MTKTFPKRCLQRQLVQIPATWDRIRAFDSSCDFFLLALDIPSLVFFCLPHEHTSSTEKLLLNWYSVKLVDSLIAIYLPEIKGDREKFSSAQINWKTKSKWVKPIYQLCQQTKKHMQEYQKLCLSWVQNESFFKLTSKISLKIFYLIFFHSS